MKFGPYTIVEQHIPAMIQATAYLRGRDMSESAAVKSVCEMYVMLLKVLGEKDLV